MSNPFGDVGQEAYGPENEDMSDVADTPPLPAVGWHRGTITAVSTRPSNRGVKMRTVTFRVAPGINSDDGERQEYDDINEYFAIGANQTKGEKIASRNYKLLARCVGVEENDEGKFHFSSADLEDEELYVRVNHEQSAGYPLQARCRGFRPLDDPPEEVNDRDVNDDSSDETAPF